MSHKLEQDIAVFLGAVLEAKAYQKRSSVYYADVFGNEIITYESTPIILTFATDRGDLYVKVCPAYKKNHCVLLESLLKALGIEVPDLSSRQAKLLFVAEVLDKHSADIANALAPDALPSTERVIEDQRKRSVQEFEESLLGPRRETE